MEVRTREEKKKKGELFKAFWKSVSCDSIRPIELRTHESYYPNKS